MFEVRSFSVNYTTYDVRREQDSLRSGPESNVMVKSPETRVDAHPYWYASVLGIYHADVICTHPDAMKQGLETMEFLFVRWYGEEPGHRYGSRVARLPLVGFVPDTDEYAFSFLDPALVIRAVHLLPAFSRGMTKTLLRTEGPTIARKQGETDDWENFYVGMYVFLL
jgi:hypothetical protein